MRVDSLGRSERARGEGEREHIRRDENAGTKRGSREDLWHGRLGILEETTESGGEKVLGLFERRKDDLLRGRSACPPREMVADNAPKQPQNQENLYFDAICTANSICAESQRSTERYCEKIFQRAGEITNPAADDEGSRLQQSVFTAYAAGRGSLDVPCCLDANEDGRTAFGCEELDWREREGGHQQGSEVIGDSVIQKKDRPSWRLPSSAHPWPNPAGQKNLARDDPSVEGAGPACNLAISKPCSISPRTPATQEKGWDKEFHCLEACESTACSEDCSDDESSRTPWPSPRLKIDPMLRGEHRPLGEKVEVGHVRMIPNDIAMETLYKGRLMARLQGEILQQPTIPIWSKSMGYSAGENLLSNLAKEAHYRVLHAELFVPLSTPIFSSSDDTPQGTMLNVPAVETIRWDEVLPHVPPERRSVIEVILSENAFRKRVLVFPEKCPDVSNVRKPLMADDLQEEVINLKYVRRAKQTPLAACPIFCVPRPDGKKRLIWDGRQLNLACAPPPPFHFRPLSEQLQRLLHKKIKFFITFDFQSWFVQLKLCLARFFGTRRRKGIFIPAEGFMWRLNPHLPPNLIIFVYIDNIIIGVPEEALNSTDLIVKIIQSHALQCGLVIKKRSLECGTRVTWLGVEICAENHLFRFEARLHPKTETHLAGGCR